MNEVTARGSALVAQYLEGEGVAFELVEHEPAPTATGDAQALGRAPESVAKTVVLHDRHGYVLAIVPAANRLDLHKLREVVGASRQLQLIDEPQMEQEFGQFESGAIPPFGPALPRVEIIDERLLAEDKILCASGDHRHAVLIDPREVVRISDARVADICAG